MSKSVADAGGQPGEASGMPLGSNSTGLPRGDSTIRIIYPIDRGRDHVGWWPLTPFQVPQARQIRRSLTRDDITHARDSYRRWQQSGPAPDVQHQTPR